MAPFLPYLYYARSEDVYIWNLELEIWNWKRIHQNGKTEKTRGLIKITNFSLKQYAGIVFLAIYLGNFDKRWLVRGV